MISIIPFKFWRLYRNIYLLKTQWSIHLPKYKMTRAQGIVLASDWGFCHPGQETRGGKREEVWVRPQPLPCLPFQKKVLPPMAPWATDPTYTVIFPSWAVGEEILKGEFLPQVGGTCLRKGFSKLHTEWCNLLSKLSYFCKWNGDCW